MPDFISQPDRSDIRDVYRYLIQHLCRMGASTECMSCAAQLYDRAKIARIIVDDLVPRFYKDERPSVSIHEHCKQSNEGKDGKEIVNGESKYMH